MNRGERALDDVLYPALWITGGVFLGAVLLWNALGQPSLPACWFYTRWHIYCPGCGGTRAFIALLSGRMLDSLWFHPAVLVGAVSVAAYLVSQTLWRLKGRRGWVFRWSDRWLWGMLGLMGLHCVVHNLLWFIWGIPL
ncbi:MAG: DUF2752 domain-containing protein [Oscillospiraceae bacterium]|nr:DUF2752 domain-containing protein [Oscillospiraceae bacterium]